MFHFTIQAAVHKNVGALCTIRERVLGVSFPPERLKRIYFEIIEDVEQIVLLAFHSRKTVGYIHARRVNDFSSGEFTEISEIALLPYYQKRGAGTFLVLGVEQWGRQMALRAMKCNLKSDNEAMKALLKGCGFSESCPGAFEKTIV